jgi:5-methylcytosine-specific restriction endonuclease McrA
VTGHRAVPLLVALCLALPVAARAWEVHGGGDRHGRTSHGWVGSTSSTARAHLGTHLAAGSASSHRISHTGHSHSRRDLRQRSAFQHQHPCPSTGQKSGGCPGYVVDHVVPLKRGGADAPSNMQWQTVQAGKEKDRVE